MVVHNENLNIYIEKENQEFGNINRHKIIIPVYQIENIEDLKKDMQENHER